MHTHATVVLSALACFSAIRSMYLVAASGPASAAASLAMAVAFAAVAYAVLQCSEAPTSK